MNWEMTGTEAIILYLFFLLVVVTSTWRYAKRHDKKQDQAKAVVHAVGKYVADPTHDNWYHLGAAYAQWLEEA